MIYAEQGNRVKQISEADIQRYVEQGYRIIDEKGTVLQETVPTNSAELRLAYINHKKEIESLKEQIATLTAENSELKSRVSKKAEAVSENGDIESRPKRTRTPKA